MPLGALATPTHGPSIFSCPAPLVRPAVLVPEPRRRSSSARRRSVTKVGSTTTRTITTTTLSESNGAALQTTVRPSFHDLDQKTVEMKATVTVHMKSFFSDNVLDRSLDEFFDIFGKSWLHLELISSELDQGEKALFYCSNHFACRSYVCRFACTPPASKILMSCAKHILNPQGVCIRAGREHKPISVGFTNPKKHDAEFGIYEATFDVPASFGPIGAVHVTNSHHSEMLLGDIKVFPADQESSALTFHCSSWIHPSDSSTDKRIFFPLKYSCLPSQTPKGMEKLRKSELEAIRGNGHGERTAHERIYDYDVYNDLGDPDRDLDTKRPVLGSKEHPYPRRGRTGRPRSKIDPLSEVRTDKDHIYVPRDEAFSERKQAAFNTKLNFSMLHALSTYMKMSKHKSQSFPSLAAIDAMYEDGSRNQPQQKQNGMVGATFDLLEKELPNLVHLEGAQFLEEIRKVIKFETPEIHEKDKFAWFRDEEFARETLAGINPMSIQLVTELPIVSKLDEVIYGPTDSLITKELIDEQIDRGMTADEAVKKKRLFMLDYHDMFLPYVHKVREIDDTTLYGSRTLFFLTEDGTLRPIAIELTRPMSPAKLQWREVYTPGCDGSVTGSWLWQLAKTHVLAHDSGYHQLVSHWLRTHCCVEPYIIAANRQLSQMHPIYRLLHPHFRYTMELNAIGRVLLISGDGVIESTFSPRKYCMELSSLAYDKFWRFDMEGLPEDLIRRGMAAWEDGKLKLAIEDYPYANDGLLIWDALKEWASDYVQHYYPCTADIIDDEELQGWWTEVRTKGHEDKKDEPWWPQLDSHESLVQVLTTIMWVTSAQHAAVNFGQYPYAGYFPNRPTIARRNMPSEMGVEDMNTFEDAPEKVLLDTFPSMHQSFLALAIMDLLSSHSPDEEYLGTYQDPAWKDNLKISKAFAKFKGRLMVIVAQINEWNKDRKRKNRHGAGVVPYVLLKPSDGNPMDEKMVMEMGIPNSISI